MIPIFGALAIAIYLPSCLFLFEIAKKCKAKPSWKAWVPILNFDLLSKITNHPKRRNYFLLCFLCFFLFPFLFIDVIAFLIFCALWFATWVEIAELCKAPKWFGVFSLFPFPANIVLFAYLAFKK